ncbi:MAG: class I SAM-dependent methyltransferase [Opitutales bacterium]|nr:class I SAM-dependent methyltransferase [Opitutales bacterium]
MDADTVRNYYANTEVVDHYMKATSSVGLWASEKEIFTRYFNKEDKLLELGTGTGRIAFGLERLGYKNLTGIELSKDMVREAQRIGKILKTKAILRKGDATKLKFPDNSFDGAIFGFNGLMQIPGRENRVTAIREIFRVIIPGAYFIFTTHDRNNPKRTSYWKEQKRLWDEGSQDPRLDDFGDRFESTPLGDLYIHIPVPEEIREDLKASGFKIDGDALRSQIAKESPVVEEFSDECRFWIARKPQ